MTLAIKLEDERETGEMLKTIKLVCIKMQKGKSIASIADEVEESKPLVGKIVAVAKNFAPDYDANKIYKAIFES